MRRCNGSGGPRRRREARAAPAAGGVEDRGGGTEQSSQGEGERIGWDLPVSVCGGGELNKWIASLLDSTTI